MKTFIKNLFIILFFSIISISCSDSDLPVIGKANWLFTVKQVTSVSPSISGYPQTVISTSTGYGLTSKEADEICQKMTTTATSYSYGYTVTIKTTCTKSIIN